MLFPPLTFLEDHEIQDADSPAPPQLNATARIYTVTTVQKICNLQQGRGSAQRVAEVTKAYA